MANAIEIKDLKIERVSGADKFTFYVSNLAIPQGSFTTILGSSGCGKSTLLTFLGLLRTPTSIGENMWLEVGQDGTSRQHRIYASSNGKVTYRESDREYLRKNVIGFVLQGGELIPTLTLENNVRLALDIQDSGQDDTSKKQAVEDVLKGLKLVDERNEDLRRRFPKEMSGGQIQRGVLARAIVSKPNIILIDEPTSHLDENTATEALGLLQQIIRQNKHQTVVMISHNEKLAEKFSDHIIQVHSPEKGKGTVLGIQNRMDPVSQ